MNKSKTIIEQERLFQQGISEFNRQEFFACHETLEILWRQQREPESKFTQAIIQIAVGYHHLLNDNRKGANKLLKRAINYLLPFQPIYKDVDTSNLIESVSLTILQLKNAPDNLPVTEVLPKIKIASC